MLPLGHVVQGQHNGIVPLEDVEDLVLGITVADPDDPCIRWELGC
jgi:hypothetical protein